MQTINDFSEQSLEEEEEACALRRRPCHSYIDWAMEFHKVWIEQCRATRAIRRRFGVKSALDYLIAEKLMNFAVDADRWPEFAEELPRFQAAVWRIFNPYEIAGYAMSLKPRERKKLRRLLYLG